MNGSPASRLAVAFLWLLPCGELAAQSAPQRPSEPTPVLVELFTSEGCSSCPPADELLRHVNRRPTADGQLIVGISEHVTYWNRLGWSDPFSSDSFTARQSAYGERFHLDDVYTPQIVVNGRKQILGSDAPALLSAVKDQLDKPTVPLNILSARRNGNTLEVQFRVGALAGYQHLELIAAFTDDADVSHVARGENAGRDLHHVAVARSIARLTTITEAGEQTSHVALPLADPAPGLHGHTLILFLQSAKLGPVVGTAIQAIP